MIYILTADVHTGKTSTLLTWVKERMDVGGILAPDNGPLREMLFLRTREVETFQVEESEAQNISESDLTSICRYHFLNSSFNRAQKCLIEDFSNKDLNWLIVDEIGKLELKGDGLEPAISTLIRMKRRTEKGPKLILVIREELLDRAIEEYQLEGAKILNLGDPLPI